MKKNVREPKEEVVNVRLTKRQKVALDAAAAKEGMGLSTWLLQAALLKAQEQQR
jgi:uncharacterized protein (DUF1778 family)